jgi:hypothetical protein
LLNNEDTDINVQWWRAAKAARRGVHMLSLIDFLPQQVACFFRKRQTEPAEQECTNEMLVYEQVRKTPLASSIGARHKGCEISGHWTIRGQEVFLEYKRSTAEMGKSPEISQSISKAELKGFNA